MRFVKYEPNHTVFVPRTGVFGKLLDFCMPRYRKRWCTEYLHTYTLNQAHRDVSKLCAYDEQKAFKG